MQRSLSTSFSQVTIEKVLLALCLVVLFFASILIPSLGGSRYASPDETAVAISAEKIVTTGTPRVSESLALKYPWLHARSWVSHGPSVVPVGFLGWPIFLAPLRMILGSSLLVWAGWLLLVSSFYPFFKLVRKSFSERAAWIAVMVMAASPAVILYANRSLFPNVGLLATALWGMWLLQESKDRPRLQWAAGVMCGIAFVIRPIEAVWLFPWWLASLRGVPIRSWKKYLPLMTAFLAVLGVFFLFNAQTYGSWWNIGYWLKDNVVKNTNMVLLEDSPVKASLSSFFPFGIHPRNVLWNLRAFGREFFWPIYLMLFSGLALYIWTKVKRLQGEKIRLNEFVLSALWTVGVLSLLYGSGIYQDHVQAGAVTVANSFLRYLLPLAPMAGWAAAYLFEKTTSSKWVVGGLLFVYVGFGLHAAIYKDDEGVWQTRQELKRYAEVLEAAQTHFPPGSVIVSQRSDKIFAPHLRGVSPLPPLEQVAALVRDREANIQVGLYARPLSQAERDAWRREGVDLIDKGVFARERLYQLVPR